MALPILAAAAAAVLSLAATLTPAATDPASAQSCTWRLSAVRLYQELTGLSDTRSTNLRALLAESGVAKPGFVPDQCRAGRPTSPAPVRPQAPAAPPATGSSTSAAEKYGWGTPNRSDDFDSTASTSNWEIYDGPGHGGNGRRTPDAVSIANGVMTLTGDAEGNTAGMAWGKGQQYGRWEARVKSPVGAQTYNSLLLLWPDAENWPVGGEIDFMEISDDARKSVDMFLHYGADNNQEQGDVQVDATQWHNWAVEWTPSGVTAYLDGEQWWHTDRLDVLPPGPMHLCIQLDYFPDGGSGGQAQQLVDWVRQYPLDSASAGSSPLSSLTSPLTR